MASIDFGLRKIIRRLADAPFLGRFVRIMVATWRTPYTRELLGQTNELAVTMSREVHQAQHHLRKLDAEAITARNQLAQLEKKIDQIGSGYGSAIRGIEKCLTRHEQQFDRLRNYENTETVDSTKRLSDAIARVEEKAKWIEVDNDNIRKRLEFVRIETLFELQKLLGVKAATPNGLLVKTKSRTINVEKVKAAKALHLNLGSGHIPKAGYINIDARDLPGVDIVSDVSALPFEKATVDSIYAAHLVEHFTEQALKNQILPHWYDVLKAGGELTVIAPDAMAMLDAYSRGEFNFDQLREITFGGQEYDGDFHFTMLSPETFSKLLLDIGFKDVAVKASNRKNGACLEFEILAFKAPQIVEIAG